MFIKICGVTSVADARMVAAAGAHAIGLNFYAGSPRCVDIAVAQAIIQSLPPYADPVGVFVNADEAQIRETAQAVGLRTVQLHGDRTPALIAALKDLSVVPAFSIQDDSSVAVVLEFILACQRLGRSPSAVLVDAHVPDRHGGTGQSAPWPIARRIVERCPVPVALAGGLTPRNVGDAIRAVRPWGVDVASGVEVSPGRKEQFKVRRFVESATATWKPA
jgi:phosphoribosylanthranilate isomerase